MAIFVLKKYYRLSEAVPAYTTAVLLDPSKRKQHMTKTWEPGEMRRAVGQAQGIWESIYRDLPTCNELQPGPEQQNLRRHGEERDPSPFDKIQAELNARLDRVIDNDFLSFINDEPIPLLDLKPTQWWCQGTQRSRYPRLHRMALDFLSIPPMSDAPERTFSCARRTIPWSRAKLKARNIEMVESLSNWISQGLTPLNQGMEECVEALCEADIDSDSSDEDDDDY
jgi:hAT family C-terminal dimerisation region